MSKIGGMQGLSLSSLKKNPAVSIDDCYETAKRSLNVTSFSPIEVASPFLFRFSRPFEFSQLLLVALHGSAQAVDNRCSHFSSSHSTFASVLAWSERSTTLCAWPPETRTFHGTARATPSHGKSTVTSSTRWVCCQENCRKKKIDKYRQTAHLVFPSRLVISLTFVFILVLLTHQRLLKNWIASPQIRSINTGRRFPPARATTADS